MITTLLSLLMAGPGSASLDLHLLSSGAVSKIGYYSPQRLALTATPPAGVKAVPAGSAEYGTWSFGGKQIPVAEVSENGEPAKILIDFAGTHDFSSATSYEWKGTANPRDPNHYKLYRVEVSAPSPFGGSGTVSLSFYRFDPRDTQRAVLKDTLLYYSDYAFQGTAKLGSKSYPVMLTDARATGTLGAPPEAKAPPSTSLLIDRNGDGKFSDQFETFDASKPFNVDGVTYELTGVHGDGKHVGIQRSSKTVAEIPIPPTLSAGHRAVTFTATDVNGKTVHFPQDFKGKVVMLDFWATWCGPCMGEVPTVVKVYNDLHSKGFEILGISLDNAQTLKNIGPVTKDKGMTWNQVADGKYWDAEIGKLYGVRAIPQAYIIDGDTGMIYAEGEAIRGDNLLPAIQKALGAKGRAPK